MTPRIARNQRAAKENEALAELEATIARRKEALRQIQAEAEFLEQAQHDWERADAQAWNDLLTQHPLAGNAEALRSAASLVVLEGAAGNHPALREAYARLVGSQQIREVAGKAWDVVKPRQGVWLVRPAEDTVVMLGPGYVATDATDGAGLDAAVRVAQLLPFKNAVVVTQSLLRDKVKGLLERLGLNWSLSDLDGSRKNAPRP